MEVLMAKVLFKLQVHSVVDIITNSSSELFVGKNQSKKVLTELIKAVYPNYRDEYDKLVSLNSIPLRDFNTYLWYICNTHVWPAEKKDYYVPNGFTFEELYTPAVNWKTKLQEPPAWNGEIQYTFKKFSNAELKDIRKRFNPNNDIFLLYSLDDNPNWDMQEKLETIMERIHLG